MEIVGGKKKIKKKEEEYFDESICLILKI